MFLIAVTVPVVNGFEADMQAFLNGISLTYDNTK